MRFRLNTRTRPWVGAALVGMLAAAWSVGCTGGSFSSNGLYNFGLFPVNIGGGGDDGGDGGGGGGGDDFFNQTSRCGTDDICDLPNSCRFVTISMANYAQDDYIHYFLVLGAFVHDPADPENSYPINNSPPPVCIDELDTYRAFGYEFVPAGQEREFGDFCFQGPLLFYIHRGGRFRDAGGTTDDTNLASGIAPAVGPGVPTFDRFFTSAGVNVPTPSFILFHNPGAGAGAPLRIAPRFGGCNLILVAGDARECATDSFYYVDALDTITGSSALGSGSGRRVPSDIQGTGCQCFGTSEALQFLGTPLDESVAGTNPSCTSFYRGGRIDYAFIRDDRDPPIPQLLWRVTTSGGSVAIDFDDRAGLP